MTFSEWAELKKPFDNLAVYSRIIEYAQTDCEHKEAALTTLRSFVISFGEDMPDELLIKVSEVIRDHRRDEMQRQVELN